MTESMIDIRLLFEQVNLEFSADSQIERTIESISIKKDFSLNSSITCSAIFYSFLSNSN